MKALFLFILILSFGVTSLAVSLQVEVSKNNKFLSIKSKNVSNQIPLKHPKGMEIDAKPIVYSMENFSIAFISYSDFESATSVVYAFNELGKRLWSFNLGAFNPSKPLIEKENIYLSAIDTVWKVNKTTGKVVWHHKGLYMNRKIAFNGAIPVTRKGKNIVFAPNLIVNDSSGKLLEVK